MATNTYVALATTTVTGSNLLGTTGVTFDLTGITGYTNLRIVFSGKLTAAAISLIRFNSDSATNYSCTIVGGDGATAASTRQTNGTASYLSAYGHFNANQENMSIDILNYANATTNKTFLFRTNNGGGLGLDAGVGLWRSTSAITSIQIFLDRAEYYVVGSTFTVYGIANADNFTKATGGIISEDSTYTYHVFGSSGTFTPKQALTADVLVVAGGGAGNDGGGGAGGVAYYAAQSLTATGYTCTVGAGGAGSSNGVDSQFGALTAAVGGGKGGIYNAVAAGSGGSGGGAARVSGSYGTATAGQGYRGGSASVGSGNAAGGGGGAGAIGGDNSGATGGSGGAGVSAYNSWSMATNIGQLVSGTYYIAGGGGAFGGSTGGAAGYGGGGTGSSNAGGGTAGVANTGGGGGGLAGSSGWGAGGSGVVIVRYAK